jgi:hypothetical protein
MKDEIIRMARETDEGFETDTSHEESLVGMDAIERFFHAAYAAGAAAEREAILQMSREQWFKTQADFEEAIRARKST